MTEWFQKQKDLEACVESIQKFDAWSKRFDKYFSQTEMLKNVLETSNVYDTLIPEIDSSLFNYQDQDVKDIYMDNYQINLSGMLKEQIWQSGAITQYDWLQNCRLDALMTLNALTYSQSKHMKQDFFIKAVCFDQLGDQVKKWRKEDYQPSAKDLTNLSVELQKTAWRERKLFNKIAIDALTNNQPEILELNSPEFLKARFRAGLESPKYLQTVCRPKIPFSSE